MGNKASVAGSFAWKLLERTGSQLVNIVVQIVLARIIAPSEFGVLATLIVFVNYANIFVQKGFSSSLIRKTDADKKDYDTAFIISILIAVIAYCILFFLSPAISTILNESELKNGIRIISISLIFGALYCVQNAILVKNMRFKTIFFASIVSSIISGIVGIVMALKGYGLWALVVQTVSQQILLCVTGFCCVKWKPGIHFSKHRLKEIFSFGGNVLTSELLSYTVESARVLFVGKIYSKDALSYYDRGQTYPSVLMRGIYDTIGSVLLPAFSKKKDDKAELAVAFQNVMSLILFIVTPVFVGLAAVAPTLVPFLLTDKWNATIPFLMIFALSQLAQPVQGICRQAIYALGKSKMILYVEIIKDVISLVALIITMNFGPIMIALSFFISMVVSAIIMLIAVSRCLNVKWRFVIEQMIRVGLYSAIMFGIVFCVNFAGINLFVKLIVQIIIGVIVYISIAFMLKDSNAFLIKNTIVNKVLKSFNK